MHPYYKKEGGIRDRERKRERERERREEKRKKNVGGCGLPPNASIILYVLKGATVKIC